MNLPPHILVVEDEPLNMEFIKECLQDTDYQLSYAEDGAIALQILEASPGKFDVILLDRMMPNISGMEVLKRIIAHPELRHCPVIFQTACTSNDEIIEGMEAGAHYYLTKPFQEEMLLSIVKTAVNDRINYKQLQQELSQSIRPLQLMYSGDFYFQSLDEGRDLATFIARACPDGSSIVMGLSELLINAIEHGNLGIGYDDKTLFVSEGCWQAEINKRLELPENKDKFAKLSFRRSEKSIEIIIKDKGEGFDWKKYVNVDPARAFDNHGRGIALAAMLGFSQLSYHEGGSKVYATILL